ncbi:flagellar hook-associated protein FlgL [Cellulomonas fimi]|uniref:Flagellar hook-associated protein 3 n=1 Tax=Cellulomonas fimi (strain ATCC 484 / DSM 20113 / JCM 1341 / CCUG 24087 / LMG 16345 / NBRC 15513 / NCIMB 8980 / NCTC 7547 / NRS-133) TaxID=590998 RepID=F4GYT1_CELFA|nr:flagellar hook-associated protein FlgL [Cellulomonas fimi]AEE44800.1 flagellar hook-associated protein 3 [Cellulomonas fimi ATCC 484]NNH08384.1 flagellar hook-associated protein FlgL [Cellulomonas fimi]VEH27328.1 Hook-filament junction protein [Cellulomonas fimi]
MIPRVTHLTVQRQTLANLQGNLTSMADLQSKLSSGKKITVPSDDPAGASDVLRLRGEQRALTQYARNATDGDSWLTTVDSALQSSLTAMRRARDLTMQGGNGGLGQTSRDALAAEIEGVRGTLMDQANATYAGRTVFAGTSAAGFAFDASADPALPAAVRYAWHGVAGASVERRVGDATTVRVDADGSAVFGDGDTSVFALLDQVATTLRSGGDPTTHLAAIDDRMEAMLGELSATGARQNQIGSAQQTIVGSQLTTKTQLSGIEDIDLAQTILEIQMQEVAYNGALGAAAKVLQPSLMDFLR